MTAAFIAWLAIVANTTRTHRLYYQYSLQIHCMLNRGFSWVRSKPFKVAVTVDVVVTFSVVQCFEKPTQQLTTDHIEFLAPRTFKAFEKYDIYTMYRCFRRKVIIITWTCTTNDMHPIENQKQQHLCFDDLLFFCFTG